MKVALVNPPSFASITTFAQESVPPLGLAYVCAATTNAGHDVTVVDAVGLGLDQHRLYPPIPRSLLTGLSPADIVTRIPSDVDVIGVSCMFSNAWPPTRDLLRTLRAAFPRARIVLGGEHASACARHILETCSFVDACVIGEGEETFVELLDALQRGGHLDAVPGALTARCGSPVPSSCTRRPRLDVRTIPRPDWNAFPLEAYLAGGYVHGVVRGRTMPILATRGCPYACTFCSAPGMWQRRWQARDPHDVIDEMRHCIARYRVDDFAFYDLTAAVSRRWIIELCRLLIAARLGVTWQLPSGTRMEALDEEVCALLFRSGCRNLNLAPETGSPRMLRVIGKQLSIPRLLHTMETAVRAGLQVKINIIMGFPGETVLDIAGTLELVARSALLGAEAVSIFPFVPYPGSRLFEQLEAEGRLQLDDSYFANLVYTDPGRLRSYSEHLSRTQLMGLMILGNALFLAVQSAVHPRRTIDLATQILQRRQGSKLANAVEPMRRKLDQWRRLKRNVSADQRHRP